MKVDDECLRKYEEATGKGQEARNIRHFLSFCSKFMHFHLPNAVFILDSYSSAHAKKTGKNSAGESCYVYKIENEEYKYVRKKDFKDLKNNVANSIHFLSEQNTKDYEKEFSYVEHACRSYLILKMLSSSSVITPRMEDNFIMHANTDTGEDTGVE